MMEDGRIKAASELFRIVKPGAYVFAAAHTVFGWLNGLLDRAAQDIRQIPKGAFRRVLDSQRYDNPIEGAFTGG